MWWKVFCTLDIPIHLYMYQLYLKYHHKYTSIAVECGFVGAFLCYPKPIAAYSWAAFVILFMRLNSFQIHNNAFVISVCLFALSENALFMYLYPHTQHTPNEHICEYVCCIHLVLWVSVNMVSIIMHYRADGDKKNCGTNWKQSGLYFTGSKTHLQIAGWAKIIGPKFSKLNLVRKLIENISMLCDLILIRCFGICDLAHPTQCKNPEHPTNSQKKSA